MRRAAVVLLALIALAVLPVGPGGITRWQCTAEYKLDAIDRTIRRVVLCLPPRHPVRHGVLIRRTIGLSADELPRIARTKRRFALSPWSEPRFPLEELEMTRGDCARYLAAAFPGREIPRSACVYCPFHDQAEWARIQSEPEDWSRAVEVDEGLRADGAISRRGVVESLYVHRQCVPLALANLSQSETRLDQYTFGFARECEGICGN